MRMGLDVVLSLMGVMAAVIERHALHGEQLCLGYLMDVYILILQYNKT